MPSRKINGSVAIVFLIFALQSCAGLQNAVTSQDYGKTRTGAGIGAAAGGVIGLPTRGNKLDNALIGAALGGIVGGAIGNCQDRQQSKLRQQMAGTGVDIVRQGDNITLDMPGGVTFLSDSVDVRSESYGILDKVASTLAEYGETVIEVAGHTDSVGATAYNQQNQSAVRSRLLRI